MMRHFGFIIIIAASYGIGVLGSKAYRDRYKEVALFRSIVLDMANTIMAAPLSLSEICLQYAQPKYSPFSEAFKTLGDEASLSPAPCDEVWDKAINGLSLSSTAAQKALYHMAIGAFLLPEKGRLLSVLKVAEGRLEEEAKLAKEEMATKGKIAQRLSLVCGVFAVIILW